MAQPPMVVYMDILGFVPSTLTPFVFSSLVSEYEQILAIPSRSFFDQALRCRFYQATDQVLAGAKNT